MPPRLVHGFGHSPQREGQSTRVDSYKDYHGVEDTSSDPLPPDKRPSAASATEWSRAREAVQPPLS